MLFLIIGQTVRNTLEESTSERDRYTSLFSGAEKPNCDGFRGHEKNRDTGRKMSSKVRASLDPANKASLHDHTRQGWNFAHFYSSLNVPFSSSGFYFVSC